ncbi:hypothetical protein RFI_36562 [Reticulomyxa filosa]|uniref:Transmembrane protein n=1 Tax=Reticulomyxa filosa TaxID=46433 RepID=X6LFZ7_RETFI|nr:hypothetical protein RFI_36562 [Reticulomyxa filosa]|eukprot:ETO00878.1 hypothetical protein RFI_36562 [Reticulomyxa filosa]
MQKKHFNCSIFDNLAKKKNQYLLINFFSFSFQTNDYHDENKKKNYYSPFVCFEISVITIRLQFFQRKHKKGGKKSVKKIILKWLILKIAIFLFLLFYTVIYLKEKRKEKKKLNQESIDAINKSFKI